MSSKTKIVILKSKNLIWAAVGLVIVILLIILLMSALHLGDKQSQTAPVKETLSTATAVTAQYIPGIYTTTITLGSSTADLTICVDKNHINSISLNNLEEAVETMYPMVPTVLNSLATQILSAQSMDTVTYADSTQYTSSMLLEAISRCLALAKAS